MSKIGQRLSIALRYHAFVITVGFILFFVCLIIFQSQHSVLASIFGIIVHVAEPVERHAVAIVFTFLQPRVGFVIVGIDHLALKQEESCAIHCHVVALFGSEQVILVSLSAIPRTVAVAVERVDLGIFIIGEEIAEEGCQPHVGGVPVRLKVVAEVYHERMSLAQTIEGAVEVVVAVAVFIINMGEIHLHVFLA